MNTRPNRLPTGPFRYLDSSPHACGILQEQIRHDVAMAKTRKFTSAKENDATIPLGVLQSLFQQGSGRRRVFYPYPAPFARYVDISEARKPLIATFREESLKRIIAEAFRANIAIEPNVTKDWRTESLLPLR